MSNIEYYYHDIWQQVLETLLSSEAIDKDTVNLYFMNSKLYSLDQQEAIIVVEEFINCIVMAQHDTLVESILETIIHRPVVCKFVTSADLQKESPVRIEEYFINRELDQNYVFGNFVIGKSNIQAQSASMLVSNNLGLMYNPLFIYGNSGLGKTHLINAIGNDVKKRNSNINICYVSGQDFVDGVAKSSKDKNLDEFKESFNNIDLLLVDDIQFITGKPKTQEIFFSIFNNLVNNKKQICLTADKLPSEIDGLEPRIITRFNQDLTVNIEAPEYETSINIIKMKLSNQYASQEVDEDVISFIASNFSQDVRSLEGAINRLLFYKINFGKEGKIDLEFAKEAFKDQVEQTKGELTIKQIKKVVCDYYNLTTKQLVSKTRTSNIANARHICMYLCKSLLDAPYEEIGKEFGGKDHSTVISACRKIDDLVKTNELYSKAINDIKTKLHNN